MSRAARLAELEQAALARFPGEAATLGLFLAELARVLADAKLAASEGVALATRLEDYLEALLVREGWR